MDASNLVAQSHFVLIDATKAKMDGLHFNGTSILGTGKMLT